MAGRSKGPWFWRGAWYAKLKNRRYYLCPGPETPERLTAAKEKYDELVRRLKGRSADPRIEEINRVLAERPEWIEVVRAILGIREDVAVFGRSAKWLELFKGAMESLVSGVGEAAGGSILLEVEHPNPAPIVSPLGGSGTSADDLKKSIRGYLAFDEEEKDIADRLVVTAAEVGLNGEQTNNAFRNFWRQHSDLSGEQRNAILADPEKVRTLGTCPNPSLALSTTPAEVAGAKHDPVPPSAPHTTACG